MGLLLPLFALVQVASHLAQSVARNEKYAAAREFADATGKPLLVVGGPWGDNPFRCLLTAPAHGWGDVCLDISEEACLYAPETVVADVREIPFPDGYFGAAFVSHVLEHLPSIDDCRQAVGELLRVADRVWVAAPSKLNLLAWLIPDHHLWVRQEDGYLEVEERTLWSRMVKGNPRTW